MREFFTEDIAALQGIFTFSAKEMSSYIILKITRWTSRLLSVIFNRAFKRWLIVVYTRYLI